jgi:protein ImuB
MAEPRQCMDFASSDGRGCNPTAEGANICSTVIVSVLLPRFELVVAAGGRGALAEGPVALAPEPGREQLIGEVSAAAEAAGVHPGMRLGEALSRCPRLELIAPNPVAVADAWEAVLVALEGIGAAVEPGPRPGSVCFDADGLARLHGGAAGALAAGRGELAVARGIDAGATWLGGVVAVTRRALGVPARIGAGPSRFCAQVAAAVARSRRLELVSGAEDLAGQPVTLLRRRPEVAELVEPLEQLGIGTLGALAALPAGAVSDRFGRPGLRARELARGRDGPLRARTVGETLQETLELAESASGTQLQRALELLIDHVLARRERRGRTLRTVVMSARLVEGGTWRDRVVFREPLADPQRMRLALSGRLALLPSPADALRLTVERFGPPHRLGDALFEDGAAERRARLREAVRQARAVAGPEAALRVLTIEPDSRVPERRALLTPFE